MAEVAHLRKCEPTPMAGRVDKQSMVPGLPDLLQDTSAVGMNNIVEMTKNQAETPKTLVQNKEFKDRIIDDILAMVVTKMAETPASSQASTPNTEEPPNPSDPHHKPGQKRPFQATVEDDTDSQADMMASVTTIESDSHAPESSRGPLSHASSMVSRCSTPTSSVVESSVSSKSSTDGSAKRAPPSSAMKDSAIIVTREFPQPSPKPRPTVHFSERPSVILNNRSDPVKQIPESRPRILPGDMANKDFIWSAVDLKWGRLFNDSGEPTARLGQFLRGIANYIITEYSPVNSLVVTPAKLYAFYSQFKLDSEAFPFQSIFNCQSSESYKNLELLYHDLNCEYHLVQSRPDSKPRIPALTPTGFQVWMIRHILTFPSQESKRLSQVIAELPITADGPGTEGKPERLPRQLSRHLLPSKHDQQVHNLVVSSISDWLKDAGLSGLPRQSRDESDSRKDSFSDAYKEQALCRYKPEGRNHSDSDSSKKRHKSRGRSVKEHDLEPLESPRRYSSRVYFEGDSRHDCDRSRSRERHGFRAPSSINRYRYSGPQVQNDSDKYSSDASGHSSSGSPLTRSSSYSTYPKLKNGDRSSSSHSREPDYRLYAGSRDLKVKDSRRENLVSSEDAGLTYEEFLRTRPSSSRSLSFK